MRTILSFSEKMSRKKVSKRTIFLIKKISYVSLGSNTKTVVLTFVKQENGQFLLIRKFALGLDRTEQTDDGVRV